MKTVVITGANRGLGLAIARRLLQEGYGVVGIARSRTKEVDDLEGAFNGEGVIRWNFVPFDLAHTDKIHDLSLQVQELAPNVYGLVNNAAIGLEGLLATQHERDIERLLQVNLLAAILLTKYLSRPMLIRQEGRIVNVSSIIANTGFSGLAVYGATKAALLGFTKSLARELGKAGITVNSVCPGYMETDMTSGMAPAKLETIRRRSPFGKFPEVTEVAAAVAYLLGPDARTVTGSSITVDAGSTA